MASAGDAAGDEDEEDGAPQGDEEQEDEAGAQLYPSLPQAWPAITARRLRIGELVLVLLVAYGSATLGSIWDLWTGREAASYTPFGLVNGIQRQTIELAVLAYVLFRRGQSFRDLGLTWRWIDVPAGGLLFIASTLAEVAARRTMNWLAVVASGHPVSFARPHEHFVGLAAITLGSVYAVVDSCNEELIARAFTMTEVEALTGSTALAIAASVGLQISYHLYQGIPDALSAGATFLLFACFFARFGRIVPLILAHACWDVMYVFTHT
jgi:hypothetical protein